MDQESSGGAHRAPPNQGAGPSAGPSEETCVLVFARPIPIFQPREPDTMLFHPPAPGAAAVEQRQQRGQQQSQQNQPRRRGMPDVGPSTQPAPVDRAHPFCVAARASRQDEQLTANKAAVPRAVRAELGMLLPFEDPLTRQEAACVVRVASQEHVEAVRAALPDLQRLSRRAALDGRQAHERDWDDFEELAHTHGVAVPGLMTLIREWLNGRWAGMGWHMPGQAWRACTTRALAVALAPTTASPWCPAAPCICPSPSGTRTAPPWSRSSGCCPTWASSPLPWSTQGAGTVRACALPARPCVLPAADVDRVHAAQRPCVCMQRARALTPYACPRCCCRRFKRSYLRGEAVSDQDLAKFKPLIDADCSIVLCEGRTEPSCEPSHYRNAIKKEVKTERGTDRYQVYVKGDHSETSHDTVCEQLLGYAALHNTWAPTHPQSITRISPLASTAGISNTYELCGSNCFGGPGFNQEFGWKKKR